jgi:hypothetical protein
MAIEYPCPGCGFLTYDAPPGGSFDICPVCGWEDDYVQLADPEYRGGANGVSLADHQNASIQRFPAGIQEYGGYRRDPAWRPYGGRMS